METAGKAVGTAEGMVDRFYSIPQAARALGKANATIRTMLLKGELEGEMAAGRVVVTRESVDRHPDRQPDTHQD